MSLRDLDSPADRVRAHRQADARGIVLVEGPADERLIRRVFGDEWVAFICSTRSQVRDVLNRALQLNVERVTGLIDRDFDDYFDEECISESLLYSYQEADLEAHLVEAPFFEDLLDEVASGSKVLACGGIGEVRKMITSPARVLGIFRRANAIHGWGLNFEDFDLSRKISGRDAMLDEVGLMAALRARIPSGGADEFMSACRHVEDGHRGLFRGKDALVVMAKALSRRIGSSRNVDPDMLASMLRLTADRRLREFPPFSEIARALAS